MFLCVFRGRKIYEPPRFMAASEAAHQLLNIVARRRLAGESLAGTAPSTTLSVRPFVAILLSKYCFGSSWICEDVCGC